MMDTSTGRALMLVDMILEYLKSVSQTNHCLHAIKLKAVAKDPMFDMAKKLIERQEEFFLQGQCTHVDLAFHYTTEEHLKDIQRFGLLSHQERMKKSSTLTHKNGQVFGNGIYTANNPFAFQKFGPVGLVVARLKGSCSQRVKKISHIQDGHNYTSIVGNKILENDPIGYYDEIVLLESSQVIPLVCFEKEAINFKCLESLVVEPRLEALSEVMKGLLHIVNNICNNDDNQAKVETGTALVSLNEFMTFYEGLKTQIAGNAQKNPNKSLQSNVQLGVSTAQSKVLSQATSVNVMNTIFPPMSSSTSGPFGSTIKTSAVSPAPKPTAAPYPPMSKAAPKPFPGVNKSSVSAAAPTFKPPVAVYPPISGAVAASKNSSVSATQKFPPSVVKVEQRKKSVQSTQAPPRSPDPPGAIGIGGVSTQTTSSGWTFQPKNTSSNIGGRGSLQASKAPINIFCGTAPSNDSSNAPNMTSNTNTYTNCNIPFSWGANTITFSSSSQAGFNGVIGTGTGGFSINTSTVARERPQRRIVRAKRPR